MRIKKTTTILAGALTTTLVLTACATGGASNKSLTSDNNVYREHVPKNDLNPEMGYLGDIANTAQYWKDDASLQKNSAMINDHDNEWKLNKKYMDLEKQDLHMGYVAVDYGQEFVEQLNAKNPEFSKCLSEGKGSLDSVAVNFPKFNEKLNKIMTIEKHVDHCSKVAFGKGIKVGSNENNMITMYIKSLSTGEPLEVDASTGPLADSYKRGEELFYTKAGQFNYACASCHTPQGGAMGKHLRGQTPTTVFGDASQYPVYHTKLGLLSMGQRIGHCQWQVRTTRLEWDSDAYTDLEVFLSVLTNGYPVAVPSSRN